jgi:hypothetical protein
VENSTIGIKIADGSYFPIMEEGNQGRKRLVLTTVNDNQENVQIDLYKGQGNELLEASYVGSLLIENITQGPSESSEIELKIGFDKDGTLNAEAGDLVTGQFESLSISMETLGKASMYDVPEFTLDSDFDDLKIDNLDLNSDELSLDEDDFDFDEISEEESLEIDLDSPDLDSSDFTEDEFAVDDNDLDEGSFDSTEEDFSEDDSFTPGFLSDTEMVQRKEKSGGKPLLIALLVIIAIAAIAGISYLIFRSLQGEDSPALEANAGTQAGLGTTEETVTEEEIAVPEPVVSEIRTETSAAESSAEQLEKDKGQQIDDTTKAPEIAVQETDRIQDSSGTWYKIRWGDTLWGISYSFYDSPRDYKEIVQENNIKNPNLIFAETEIFIPSK